MNVLERVFYGNTLLDWIIAFGIIAVAFTILKLLKRPVLKRIKRFTERTSNSLDDFLYLAIETTVVPFFYYLAIFVALHYLNFNTKVSQVLKVAILFVGTYFILRLISSFFSYVVYRFLDKGGTSEGKQKQARGLIMMIKAVIWILGFVFLLNNLGYDVTTIITGLGIGGIAIALAAQAILGDLFSYFVIFFDRPFEIGDFLTVGDKAGTIEYIGIKTTRMKAISGEQIVFSNKDLTDSRIHNFKRMLTRRVVFKIGVTYQTTAQQLKQIPGIIRGIIEPLDKVTFDRSHFSALGPYSLDFETVYLVEGPDYNEYMNIQQRIYLEIFQAFEQEGIEFAYPTQTLLAGNAFVRERDLADQ